MQRPGAAVPLRGCLSPCFSFTVAGQVAGALGSKGGGLAFWRDAPVRQLGPRQPGVGQGPPVVFSGQSFLGAWRAWASDQAPLDGRSLALLHPGAEGAREGREGDPGAAGAPGWPSQPDPGPFQGLGLVREHQ